MRTTLLPHDDIAHVLRHLQVIAPRTATIDECIRDVWRAALQETATTFTRLRAGKFAPAARAQAPLRLQV